MEQHGQASDRVFPGKRLRLSREALLCCLGVCFDLGSGCGSPQRIWDWLAREMSAPAGRGRGTQLGLLGHSAPASVVALLPISLGAQSPGGQPFQACVLACGTSGCLLTECSAQELLILCVPWAVRTQEGGGNVSLVMFVKKLPGRVCDSAHVTRPKALDRAGAGTSGVLASWATGMLCR